MLLMKRFLYEPVTCRIRLWTPRLNGAADVSTPAGWMQHKRQKHHAARRFMIQVDIVNRRRVLEGQILAGPEFTSLLVKRV